MEDSHTNARLSVMKDNALLLAGCVALMWGLEIVDFLMSGFFDRFGIRPRHASGLPGIAAAPWLHLGFGHLISNTIPFLVLGGIVLLGGRRTFVGLSLFIAVVGGGLLWLLGPAQTNHIGASLVIFGYLGFLLTRGFFERSLFWSLVSIGILVLYGWMIFGILPGKQGVSWQGHLFGFGAGILGAWAMFPKGAELYRHRGT